MTVQSILSMMVALTEEHILILISLTVFLIFINFSEGVVLPRPVGRCRYWHRSLNPKKLIEVSKTLLSYFVFCTLLLYCCALMLHEFV